MAKKAAEQTPAQKHTLDMRQKVELAEKDHTAKNTDATKKHLEKMRGELSQAVTAENRERFIRVGGGRVKKVRAALRNLAGVASPRTYKYDESDVSKAESVLMDEVKKTMSALRAALTRGGAAKTEDDFSF